MMKKTSCLTACTLALLFSAGAQAQMSVEDQIETRQAAYQFAAWNMGKIKAQVVDKSVAYNQDQILAAANAIAAVANSGLSALYGPGTSLDKADNTRLKPEFFEEPDKVREIAIRFVQEANKLQEVAAAGDQAALAQQFQAVGESCKACHDRYRAK